MTSLIQLARQPIIPERSPPGPCPGCGAQAWHKHDRGTRPIVDVHVTVVPWPRYRCQGCRQTVTVHPGTGRSRSFQAVRAVLYRLGLSLRKREAVWGLRGWEVDPVTCGRDSQRLAAEVWPRGKVRVVYRDETYRKIRGPSRPVGAVMDLDGRFLPLALTDRNFDGAAWWVPLTDGGVEVAVTDDASAYGPALEAHGLDRQQCRVHMKRTLRRQRKRLAPAVQAHCPHALDTRARLLDEWPADGEELLRAWRETAPREGPLTTWRRWLLHVTARWRPMRGCQQRADVPARTHRLEGRFGRIKPRYRPTRGFHTVTGALGFMARMGHVLA